MNETLIKLIGFIHKLDLPLDKRTQLVDQIVKLGTEKFSEGYDKAVENYRKYTT